MSHAMNFAFMTNEPARPNGRNVGIIGAGPSGLAAAGYLACRGYQVEVYDKLPKPGGLMVFGIPGHRIPQERIEAGVRHLERKCGVIFHTRTKICCSSPLHDEEGDHFSLDQKGLGDLVRKHDALVLCTGSWKSRKMGIPGEDLPGVYSGLEFLFPIRAARYASPNVKAPDVKDKTVLVVGAGHSAVDVAHSAVHLGAKEVVLLYRRTRDEAPCGTFEIAELEKIGATWRELVTPLRVIGEDRVQGMEIVENVLGEPDESGRACPLPGEERTLTLDCDMVVAAIGEIATPPFAHELGLENLRRGEVRWLNMTDIENVFVAGDALHGPSKIGRAVYSGLRAARSLNNWLDLRAQDRQDEFRPDDFMDKRP